jgi:hypothetical protein
MIIINGRWTTQYGEPLTTPQQHQDFTDRLNRVKQFASGRTLTPRKVEVLFKILDTNEVTDNAMTKLLEMSKKEIKNLCLV